MFYHNLGEDDYVFKAKFKHREKQLLTTNRTHYTSQNMYIHAKQSSEQFQEAGATYTVLHEVIFSKLD